jgi:hypothetical protein
MRSQSIDYWINKLGKNNPKAEPKDECENSYMQIAEYLLSRENNKKIAA